MTVRLIRCADEPRLAGGDADAVVIPELCGDPGRMVEAVPAGSRVVVHLHAGHAARAEVQKALRKAGVDPTGAQVLETVPDTDRATVDVAVAGLTARAEAFEGSLPEQVKPVLPSVFTRRGLLRPAAAEYIPTPSIDHRRCRAIDGCRACVDACPTGAYERVQGRIVYDMDTCAPCGICVTTCPVGAITNPSFTPAMLDAHLRALVDASERPPRVRFVCADRRDRSLLPAYIDVEVACTAMVTGSMLIGALALGCAAVELPGCSDIGCPRTLDDRSGDAVDFAGAALAAAGHAAVTSGRLVALASPIDAAPTVAFDREGAAETMVGLFEGPLTGGIAHRSAPMARVSIDPDTCTLCTQCTQTCPTGALESSHQDGEIAISFDPLLCTNCGQCVSTCPEVERGAITATGGVFPQLIANGRQVLTRGRVRACERCGMPIAPDRMLDRVRALLGADFEGTMDHLERRCIDCRGS